MRHGFNLAGIKQSFYDHPLRWVLLALLILATYGNYREGDDLAKVCELTGPHDVSVPHPLTPQQESGEEMTAPGPAWSAEEEDLLRSLAAAGESAAAIAALLKRSYHAIRNRADVLEIKLARSLPGPKPKWK